MTTIGCFGIFTRKESAANMSNLCGNKSGRLTRTARLVLCVRDRKSTRLNSSHLVISYAVFCLKKKKIDQCLVTPRDLLIYRDEEVHILMCCATPQPTHFVHV